MPLTENVLAMKTRSQELESLIHSTRLQLRELVDEGLGAGYEDWRIISEKIDELVKWEVERALLNH